MNCADGRGVARDTVCGSSNPKPHASQDPGSSQEHIAALACPGWVYYRESVAKARSAKGKQRVAGVHTGGIPGRQKPLWPELEPMSAPLLPGGHCHSRLWIY